MAVLKKVRMHEVTPFLKSYHISMEWHYIFGIYYIIIHTLHAQNLVTLLLVSGLWDSTLYIVGQSRTVG